MQEPEKRSINEQVESILLYSGSWLDVVTTLGLSDTIDVLTDPELNTSSLTYLAEAAGATFRHEDVLEVLVKLLDHPRAVVREGAVLGLQYHTDNDAVVERLNQAAEQDESPGVREAAVEALEEAP